LNRLDQQVADVLSTHGVLAQKVPGFQPRQGQSDMAMAVSRTVQDGGQLVVEAGTGTGKTYAYLVPVLLSGQRALVSTQQQLVDTLRASEQELAERVEERTRQ
jgi:ATP-dependent DNA helicase DinG